jgi:hypothetical protein
MFADVLQTLNRAVKDLVFTEENALPPRQDDLFSVP